MRPDVDIRLQLPASLLALDKCVERQELSPTSTARQGLLLWKLSPPPESPETNERLGACSPGAQHINQHRGKEAKLSLEDNGKADDGEHETYPSPAQIDHPPRECTSCRISAQLHTKETPLLQDAQSLQPTQKPKINPHNPLNP